MSNITIPASITIPEDSFNSFVERLGYFAEVEDPKNSDKMIENPESSLEFAQRVFKEERVMPWLLQFINQDIDIAINNARDEERAAQKKAAYDALEPAVTVG